MRHQRVERDHLGPQLDPSRLDLGEIEHVVDELEQMLTGVFPREKDAFPPDWLGFSQVKSNLAPLAQLAEQVTLNHWVVGSIPTRCKFR